jgi:hypothetical protein
MLHLILYLLLAVLARGLFVLVFPYRRCRWCARKPRGRSCWRCHGTRDVRRFGAGIAVKVRNAVKQAWAERGLR